MEGGDVELGGLFDEPVGTLAFGDGGGEWGGRVGRLALGGGGGGGGGVGGGWVGGRGGGGGGGGIAFAGGGEGGGAGAAGAVEELEGFAALEAEDGAGVVGLVVGEA